jgi:hypothetical protein
MSKINVLIENVDTLKTLLIGIQNMENDYLSQISDLNKQILSLNKVIEEKDDELMTYKKTSLVAQLNKQLMEQKSQMQILEQQLNHYKSSIETYSQKAQSETIINKLKNEILEKDKYISSLESKKVEEPKKEEVEKTTEPEYEIISIEKKKYYLVGKKVYKMNKDKSIGDYYGRYKNGEVVPKVDA